MMAALRHFRTFFLLLAFAAAAARPLFGEALWWVVGDLDDVSVSVEGESSPWTATQVGGIDSIRVRVYDTESYLDFYYQDQGGSYVVQSGADSAAVPGGGWISLGDYADPAYSFMIELGNWNDGAWTVRAEAQVTYNTLNGHISVSPLDNPGYTPYNVATEVFTAVPEPSSGILFLFGTMLLALRRRREPQ